MRTSLVPIAILCLSVTLLLPRCSFASTAPAPIDSFPGPNLNSTIWQEWPPTGSSGTGITMTVNNGLTVDCAGDYNFDATTKAIKVALGQGVRTGVQVLNWGPNNTGRVMLSLTNNSSGSQFAGTSDTRQLQVTAGSDTARAVVWKDFFGSAPALAPGLALDSQYYFEIIRNSSNSATFNVLDNLGGNLGSMTINNISTFNTGFAAYPNDLFIMLHVAHAKAKFTDVTMIPEPAVGTLALLLLALPLRRTRHL